MKCYNVAMIVRQNFTILKVIRGNNKLHNKQKPLKPTVLQITLSNSSRTSKQEKPTLFKNSQSFKFLFTSIRIYLLFTLGDSITLHIHIDIDMSLYNQTTPYRFSCPVGLSVQLILQRLGSSDMNVVDRNVVKKVSIFDFDAKRQIQTGCRLLWLVLCQNLSFNLKPPSRKKPFKYFVMYVHIQFT